MSKNKHLINAKKAKNDEFYTQMPMIEEELKHYKKFFKKKTVFCNCDDPYESNFFKYFALNFNSLKLKKLIATCYGGSPVSYTELEPSEKGQNKSKGKAYKVVITEVKDVTGDGRVDLADVEYLIKNRKNILTTLQGDGDFRSEECIELLKQSDIVVTNPPFSLFREYMAQLIKYDKKFIIIGNINVVTYKEIFPLLKENKIWMGYYNGKMTFTIHDHSEFFGENDGQKFKSMGNICWFTNLDIKKRHENLILFKKYSAIEYPKYDNYDAIEVSKVANIPCDYYGAMGVPITFMDKYNPDQFDILGNLGSYAIDGYSLSSSIYVNGKKIFKRIAIKRKLGERL